MSHIWATFVLCIVFSGIISAGGGGGNAGGCDHLKEQLKTLLGNAGSCKKLQKKAQGQTGNEYPTCSNIYALGNMSFPGAPNLPVKKLQ
uniref:Secreted protein n=1 Tax=Trichobilharzia regenti TaxID=157069 RepID=A0AA85J0Z1_TRIRE|nr:unnamed protein product [Trichobilharzia regenti]